MVVVYFNSVVMVRLRCVCFFVACGWFFDLVVWVICLFGFGFVGTVYFVGVIVIVILLL